MEEREWYLLFNENKYMLEMLFLNKNLKFDYIIFDYLYIIY